MVLHNKHCLRIFFINREIFISKSGDREIFIRNQISFDALYIHCAIGVRLRLTLTDSKLNAMMKVPTQFTTPATAIAFGRGPWRNSSAPIIIGIGPATVADSQTTLSTRFSARHTLMSAARFIQFLFHLLSLIQTSKEDSQYKNTNHTVLLK